jgi:hypothetical protein
MDKELTKDPSWREGGVSGALAYLLLSASTEWLGFLPAVPDGQMLEYTAAVGTALAGLGRAIRWMYRNWAPACWKRKEME